MKVNNINWLVLFILLSNNIFANSNCEKDLLEPDGNGLNPFELSVEARSSPRTFGDRVFLDILYNDKIIHSQHFFSLFSSNGIVKFLDYYRELNLAKTANRAVRFNSKEAKFVQTKHRAYGRSEDLSKRIIELAPLVSRYFFESYQEYYTIIGESVLQGEEYPDSSYKVLTPEEVTSYQSLLFKAAQSLTKMSGGKRFDTPQLPESLFKYTFRTRHYSDLQFEDMGEWTRSYNIIDEYITTVLVNSDTGEIVFESSTQIEAP